MKTAPCELGAVFMSIASMPANGPPRRARAVCFLHRFGAAREGVAIRRRDEDFRRVAVAVAVVLTVFLVLPVFLVLLRLLAVRVPALVRAGRIRRHVAGR